MDLAQYTLEPNKMQVAFVENLMRMRCENVERALLLSSTGTGKILDVYKRQLWREGNSARTRRQGSADSIR